MQIVLLSSATIAACKKINEADVAFNQLLTTSAGPSRHELVDQLVNDPSADKLAALVHFDQAGKTLADLQNAIISSNLSPSAIYGQRLRTVLAGPLQTAIEELRAELNKLDVEGSAACDVHGLDYQPGPEARSLAERIAVAGDVLRCVFQGNASPLKIFARLGYSLDGKVDAQALSEGAINAHRAAVRVAAQVVEKTY